MLDILKRIFAKKQRAVHELFVLEDIQNGQHTSENLYRLIDRKDSVLIKKLNIKDDKIYTQDELSVLDMNNIKSTVDRFFNGKIVKRICVHLNKTLIKHITVNDVRMLLEKAKELIKNKNVEKSRDDEEVLFTIISILSQIDYEHKNETELHPYILLQFNRYMENKDDSQCYKIICKMINAILPTRANKSKENCYLNNAYFDTRDGVFTIIKKKTCENAPNRYIINYNDGELVMTFRTKEIFNGRIAFK